MKETYLEPGGPPGGLRALRCPGGWQRRGGAQRRRGRCRAGCKNIVLMERYGYSGGDVTGGYVIMVPDLSWYEKSFVRGLQEEWFTRLGSIPQAVRAPGLADIGSQDPVLVDAWSAIHDCVSRSEPKRLVRAVYFEPNQLKIEMDKMLRSMSRPSGCCTIAGGPGPSWKETRSAA